MIHFSLKYFLYMTGSSLVYIFIPYKLRNYWLVLVGIAFGVLFIPEATIFLIAVILMNFSAAKILDALEEKMKGYIFKAGIFLNVLMLIIYKFTEKKVNHFTVAIGSVLLIMQCISYLVEIYRGNLIKYKGFMPFVLYITFFPKVAVGPIQKPQNLIPQFYKEHKLDLKRMQEGLLLILWGVFQKTAVADRLAIITDKTFSNPTQHFGIEMLLGAFFFFIQLYCDYCGFIDISIGFSHIMGFHLTHNFNMPMALKSPKQLWERYNTSIIQWMEDYLVKPIGDFSNKLNQNRATFLKYFFSGCILGFNFGSFIWGIISGITGAGYVQEKSKKSKIGSYLISKIMVIAVIIISAIFIRSQNMSYSLIYIENMFKKLSNGILLSKLSFDLGITQTQLALDIVASYVLIEVSTYRYIKIRQYPENIYRLLPDTALKAVYLYFFIALFVILAMFETTPFLYSF